MSETAITKVIPKWKRAWMYEVWALSKNDHEVHRVCDVHLRTISKYRDLEDWESRLALEIEGKVAAEPEKKLEIARKQAIRELQIVRGKALEAIMSKEFAKPADAWKAYREALDQEMSLRGHVEPKNVSLILIAAERFQEQQKQLQEKQQQKQDPKDITDQVEVN